MFVIRYLMVALKAVRLNAIGDSFYRYLVSQKKLSDQDIIKYSGYFDEKYYRTTCHQIVGSRLDPLTHYLQNGTYSGCNPSKYFDAVFYVRANPECFLSNKNPIIHYVSHGRSYGALKCTALDQSSVIEGQVNSVSRYFSGTKKKKKNTKKALHGKGKKTQIAAFFTHNLNLEGATLVCRDIVLGVKASGNITPIVFSPLGGALKEDYEKRGVKVILYPEFDPHRIRSLSEYSKYISKVSNILDKFNVDVIYGNTILSFWIAHLANYLNKPSLLHIHESEPINYHVHSKDFNFVPLIVHALEFSYRVVFVSNHTRDKYEPYNKNDNHTVIKNALDAHKIPINYASSQLLRNELNIAENELMFINVGTVTNRKGQVDIINSLEYMSAETLALVHFVFIGDVDTLYSQYLHKVVDKLSENISEKVHFVKKTGNVFDYYNAADVFVFTSRIESYPKVIQEAMHFKLPIITTPVDGIVEQLQNDISGLFYPPGDVLALSDLVARVSSDEKLRERLGGFAFSALECMISPDDMMESYSQLLTEASSV